MGSWKLGYADGLESVANENAGKALYAPWSVNAITLSTNTTIERQGGQIVSIGANFISSTPLFTTDQFNGGFCKIMSGDGAGNVYKISDTITDSIYLVDEEGDAADVTDDNVAVGDYFEVVSAAPTFVFAENRNPLREDIKETQSANIKRFAFYEGGSNIAKGKQPDDFVFFAKVTDMDAYKELKILENLKIDYSGYDGNFTSSQLAPLILETGTHDADHQFLVHVLDVKMIRDGKMGSDVIDVTVHCQQTGIPSYRGV